MANITIEMVDKVMERVENAKYEDVKEALIESDGNVLDAIIYLEKKSKPNLLEKNKENIDSVVNKLNIETDKLKEQVLDFVENVKKVRLIVESKDRTILNVPIGVGVGALTVVPVTTLIGLSGAILTNCTVKIQDEDSEKAVEFGLVTPSDLEVLTEMMTRSLSDLKKSFESAKKTKSNESDLLEDKIEAVESYKEKDSLDITDDLIEEK